MKRSVIPKITAAVGGAGTIIICIIMNMILIPKIEAGTQGIRCFDMNFGYSPGTARSFLSLIGDEGRFIYLNRQLPLDFIYPILYTMLFISLFLLLAKSVKKGILLSVLPVILALSDYIENIMSIIMLKNGVPSDSFALIASCVTSVKTVLMYLIFLIIIILLIRLIFIKRGEKLKNADS